MIAARYFTGTHPNYIVTQVLVDALYHCCKCVPANAIDRIQSLPAGVPDAVGRSLTNVVDNDTGFAVRCDVVIRIDSGWLVLPDAKLVHGVRHQVVDTIFTIARLQVNAVVCLTGTEEARHSPTTKLPLLCQVKQCLPDFGVRVGDTVCSKFGVTQRTDITAAARPGESGELNAGSFTLGDDVSKVVLVILNGDIRFVQPQTLMNSVLRNAICLKVK